MCVGACVYVYNQASECMWYLSVREFKFECAHVLYCYVCLRVNTSASKLNYVHAQAKAYSKLHNYAK